MTNGDKIRQMSDEELAEFIEENNWRKGSCKNCADTAITCTDCWLEWLESEVEE